MSLLVDRLTVQMNRVDALSKQQDTARLNEASSSAAKLVATILPLLRSLKLLAELPQEFQAEASDSWKAARQSVQKAVKEWDRVESDPGSAGVERVRTHLHQVDAMLPSLVTEAKRSVRALRQTHERAVVDAEFLSQQLGMDDETKVEIRSNVSHLLATLGELIEGSEADGFTAEWQKAKTAFDQDASVRACLQQARLADDVSAIVQMLLDREDVPIEDIEEKTLSELLKTPALRRIVRLALPRESNP